MKERLEELASVIKDDWGRRNMNRPPIVTLCGSTRFKDAFLLANQVLTMKGIIVISLGVFGNEEKLVSDEEALGEQVKRDLDNLHFEKIAVSDYALMLNVGLYLGPSADRERRFAKAEGKTVMWLEHLPMSVREIVNEWAAERRDAPRKQDGGMDLGAINPRAELPLISQEILGGLTVLFMVADPSPLGHRADDAVREFLNRCSQEHGYETWTDAFHALNGFGAKQKGFDDKGRKEDGAKAMKDPGLPSYLPTVEGFDDKGRPVIQLTVYPEGL